MVIMLTDTALEQLKTMELEKNKFPRIDANMVGGPGVSITFSLVFDEPRRNDLIIEYEGVQIRIDYFTKYYLEKETQIDYTEEQRFIVGESLASNVRMIKVE